MSSESLWVIIVALIAAHYLSLVWEIRKGRQENSDLAKELRKELGELSKQVSDAAIAAANAATAAATLAKGKQ